jgi:hypothetical protein
MQTPIDLAAISLLGFGVVMLGLQFGALWLGAKLGRRHTRRVSSNDKDPAEGVGVVVGALLGLLAFTLGVTISIADNRFEDRRRAAIDEANAIGTAWLRAQAIGHPRTNEIARLLEGYAEARIDWLAAPRGSDIRPQAIARTAEAQGLIWGHATAVIRERPDPAVATLLTALNETFDLAAKQRWAFRGQMPLELPWLLFTLTLVSVAGIGYQWGLKNRWHPVLASLLLAAWSGCLVLIADLVNPRVGGVRVDVAPYIWTLESFKGGVEIPPLP